MTPTFLDATVFIYAAGREHPLRAGCRDVLRAVESGELAATTSVEVLQELLHVLSQRGHRDQAVTLARNVMALFPKLLPVNREVMSRACSILEQSPGISSRDAVHAATMQEAGISTIISPDRHFDAIEGIIRKSPG